MLDVWSAVRFYLGNQGVNDAKSYGVKVEKVPGALYRVIGVHHLTPQENAGLHHVFLMVVDAQGHPVRGIPVGWDWVGRHDNEPARPVALDKPDNEPMGNIAMGKGQVVTVWVQGAAVSDQVTGLSTGHPDEAPGNTVGHHSFLVVWQVGESPTQPNKVRDLVDTINYELANAALALGNAQTLMADLSHLWDAEAKNGY